MRKKSPTKFIEELSSLQKPEQETERGYSKFSTPEFGVVYSTKESNLKNMIFDKEKLERLSKKYGKYTLIHTHPGGNPFPSSTDINTFLKDDNYKTEIIAPTIKGKVTGYLVMRKTKKIADYKEADFLEEAEVYDELVKSKSNSEDINKSLKKILNKYSIQSKWVKNKNLGYEVYNSNIKKILENRVFSIIISLVLLSSLIFISSNITGYSILENQFKTNLIGGGLFIIGLIGFLFYLKIKK